MLTGSIGSLLRLTVSPTGRSTANDLACNEDGVQTAKVFSMKGLPVRIDSCLSAHPSFLRVIESHAASLSNESRWTIACCVQCSANDKMVFVMLIRLLRDIYRARIRLHSCVLRAASQVG